MGGERLDITVADGARLAEAQRLLEPLGVGPAVAEENRRSLLMPVSGGAAVLMNALRQLDVAGIEVDDVGLRRPTLDDVFLTLTGHAAKQSEDEAKPAEPVREGVR